MRLHYLRLAASLGEHSVPPADALLLLRLAAAPRHQLLQHQHGSQAAEASGRAGESSGPAQEDSQRGPAAEDSQRWAELQMQMLFVLGVIAEHAAPPAFFSFDGSGVLPLPPLAHFPPAKTGFTLSFWLRLGAQPADDPEVSLLALHGVGGHRLLELSLTRVERDASNALPMRVLTLRTGPAHETNPPSRAAAAAAAAAAAEPHTAAAAASSVPASAWRFDALGLAECGGWHHVAVTHSRAGASLLVDGVLVESAPSLLYPELPARASARHAGAKSPLPPPEPSRFCGQMSALHLSEGCWDAGLAARVYCRGTPRAHTTNTTYRAEPLVYLLTRTPNLVLLTDPNP